jgi:hypothetical protein
MTSFKSLDAPPGRQPVRLAEGTIEPARRNIELRTVEHLGRSR